MSVVIRFAGVAFFGLCAAVACGGSGGAPPSGNPDGGAASPAVLAACDLYFDALYANNCGGVPPPADELARVKVRFERVCAAAVSLPGAVETASYFETCANALNTLGCGQLNLTPGPCAFIAGSRGGGAPCLTDHQCQSGDCSAIDTCGTCAAVSAGGGPGQPCSPGCQPGTACSAARLCTTVTYGDAGARCDGIVTRCNAGLVCNLALGQCAALGGAGAKCAYSSDCGRGLVCPGPVTPTTCQSPGPAAASCGEPSDCAPGLVCDYTTHQCAAVTWASPGQPCTGSKQCLVGRCPIGSNGVPAGPCPAVIADGQPCGGQDNSKTCDTFAQCFAGACHLGLAGLCQ
jgi:hypothetical protein